MIEGFVGINLLAICKKKAISTIPTMVKSIIFSLSIAKIDTFLQNVSKSDTIMTIMIAIMIRTVIATFFTAYFNPEKSEFPIA